MTIAVEQIRANYEKILERVANAAAISGRKAEDIHSVVVTKKQPVSINRSAIEVGIRSFGENYPEEAVEKIEALGPSEGLEWNMIGHLQSRKVKLVCEHFQRLHSLDSLHLAIKLETILAEQEKRLPTFLEFNVGGEESKSGWPAWDESQWEELLPEIKQITELPHLQIQGLMTMPPLSEDARITRAYFQKLKRLSNYFAKQFPEIQWSELSMGTSADFEMAIEEGATFIRVGQAILGPRI
jgi:pyridoxal phosphate enzyme (YggS family)